MSAGKRQDRGFLRLLVLAEILKNAIRLITKTDSRLIGHCRACGTWFVLFR